MVGRGVRTDFGEDAEIGRRDARAPCPEAGMGMVFHFIPMWGSFDAKGLIVSGLAVGRDGDFDPPCGDCVGILGMGGVRTDFGEDAKIGRRDARAPGEGIGRRR